MIAKRITRKFVLMAVGFMAASVPAVFAATAAPQKAMHVAVESKASSDTTVATEVWRRSLVTPRELVALLIQKIEEDTNVCNELLAAYDYTAMNKAQDEKSWITAFVTFDIAIDKQYNKKAQVDVWQNVFMHVFGERRVKALLAECKALFTQHVVVALCKHHAFGKDIDAKIAIALQEQHAKAWMQCVLKAAADLPQ